MEKFENGHRVVEHATVTTTYGTLPADRAMEIIANSGQKKQNLLPMKLHYALLKIFSPAIVAVLLSMGSIAKSFIKFWRIKTMSKYNVYAKQMDKAFKQARTDYQKLVTKVNRAKDAVSIASTAWDKEKANFQHREAEKELKEQGATIWATFRAECMEIGKRLEGDAHTSLISPDSIDQNGMEILKSGICTASDFAELAERYKDNYTMLRIVSRYATGAYKNTPENALEERAALMAIADQTRDGRTSVMHDWDNLMKAAETMSGISHGSNSPEYTITMQNKWEEVVSPMIDAF